MQSIKKGRKFHRLVVMKPPTRINGRWRAQCRCACGTRCLIRCDALISGRTLSCGCWHRVRMRQTHTKHGAYRSKLYKVWTSMLQRCNNPKDRRYRDYGGRGILVCRAWHQFVAFRLWATKAGYRLGLSVERRNNSCGYHPSNCKFATGSEQQHNRRISKNNHTGFTGVVFDHARGLYRAEICRDGRRQYLGRFATAKAAARAYQLAKRKAA